MLTPDKDLFCDHVGGGANNTCLFSLVLRRFEKITAPRWVCGQLSPARVNEAFNHFGIIELRMILPIGLKRRADKGEWIA